MGNWNIRCDEDKVKALRVHILEECERQSFTIGEFNLLCRGLERTARTRSWEIPETLPLIPEGKTVTDYLNP